MIENGWVSLNMDGYGRVRSGTVGYGQDTVGYGQDTVDYGTLRYATLRLRVRSGTVGYGQDTVDYG